MRFVPNSVLPKDIACYLARLALLAMVALLWALPPSPVRAAERETLKIIGSSGVRVFSVEVMRTPEERGKGLMYRRELPEGQGMLFDFSPEENVSMWMKNTYISLDMIFIRADGRILRIAENTTPKSEAVISSGGPVRGVLEVIAGTAKKYGFKPGDTVAHPLFGG
ncbi:hypothetical protein X566_19920 [Afipia sp. P52-10]|uniref:DUF192 domain-containing protein n=1 Tax=Afipia sp. P52-10 TaxID=1429916 RepID=UPI0003DF0781|nr:hypothetical protein X566_19920 [Afipia sp. P52-10]